MSAAALRLAPNPNPNPAPRPSATVVNLFERHAGLDLDQLGRHVQVTRHKIAAGQHVYRSGAAFRSLFLIHTGSFRTSQLAEDGREQVCGFHMRGELMGVESIGLSAHCCEVIALEDGEVWELPYPGVLMACAQIPDLHARFSAALATEIRRERNWMLSIGTLDADQRVAAFLVDVAARFAALGYSSTHFILRMGRVDIASFLALKHETVTRALTRLVGQGLIAVDKREIRVLDAAALRRAAGQ